LLDNVLSDGHVCRVRGDNVALTIADDFRPDYITIPIEALRRAQYELRVLRQDRPMNTFAQILLANDCEQQLLDNGLASTAKASDKIVVAWEELLLSVAVCVILPFRFNLAKFCC
jgi:hypothetical protein